MRPLIIIPAFNEEASIKEVISDLRAHGFENIVVIDDGSSDGTTRQAQKNKVVVIRHLTNRGLGAALGTGFEYARRSLFDAVVTFDADGQHRAKDVKRVLTPLGKGGVDVVIGSRLKSQAGAMPLDRKVVNLLGNILTFVLYGVWTTDSQSGLRAFSRKAVECITIKTDRMEVSSEFFKEIRRNRLKFAEVPIESIYTDYSQKGSSQEKWATFKLPMRLFLRLFR